MNLKNAKHILFFSTLSLFLISCSNKLDNSVTFTSIASENIYVNFLGKVLTIKPSKSVTITEMSKGTYAYQTAFDIPTDVRGSSVLGAVSGDIVMSPQRKATVFYTSQITGEGEEKTYILSATISYNFSISDSSSVSINQ